MWLDEWVTEWVRVWVRPSLYLVDTIATTVFAESHSNFTCKMWMMRGETQLILGHGFKDQGQLWHSVYKTSWTRYILHYLSNHFQTSHVSCGWWVEEPYWFWVKVNFGNLCIRLCGQASDYRFCPITFKLHMYVVDDERRNPIEFLVTGSNLKTEQKFLCLCFSGRLEKQDGRPCTWLAETFSASI